MRVTAADEDSSRTVLAPGSRDVWMQAGKGREPDTSWELRQLMRQIEVGMRFEKSRLVRRGRSDRQSPPVVAKRNFRGTDRKGRLPAH